MQTSNCPPPQTQASSADLTEANGQWTMNYGGNSYPPPGPYPTISVSQCNNAALTFTIKGNSAGVFNSYTPPNSTPVSVAAGSAKPNGNGLDSQITGITVSNNGKTLQFSDSNHNAGNLNYVLHFTDNTTLDPIISNGGGCCTFSRGFSQTDYALMGGALLVVLVLIYLGYRNFATKRAATGVGPGSKTGADDISRNG
jgi:hypothetical protein